MLAFLCNPIHKITDIDTRYIMLKMSTVEARENFSEMINQAAYGNQRVVLTRRGKPLVAVVSLQELDGLQTDNVQLVETEN
jgi:prevent-host-death family protein